MRCTLHSPHFLHNIISRWQPLLWQRQRSGAKSLLQTRYDSWSFARCVDSSLRSFFYWIVSCARALLAEGHEWDVFLFCEILSSLLLCTRGTRSSQSEEKGLQNAFFYYEENMSSMWTRIFLIENERASLDLAFGSRIVDFTSVLSEKKSANDGTMTRSRRHTFSRERSDIFVFGSTFHSAPTLCV